MLSVDIYYPENPSILRILILTIDSAFCLNLDLLDFRINRIDAIHRHLLS